MYEASGNLTDRVHIRFGSDSVTLESLHTSDTHDRILDLCVQAIRGLGFHFKHPHDEIAEYEKTLARIGEIVDSHIDEDGLLGAASVEDLVRKAIETLLEGIAREQGFNRTLKQFAEEQAEENQDLKQIRDDLQLKVSTQQIGIDAQKARIDAQKARIEELTTRLQVLDGPICTKDDDTFRVQRGTFAWAMAYMMSGRTVRRLGWAEGDESFDLSKIRQYRHELGLDNSDVDATDWVLA